MIGRYVGSRLQVTQVVALRCVCQWVDIYTHTFVIRQCVSCAVSNLMASTIASRILNSGVFLPRDGQLHGGSKMFVICPIEAVKQWPVAQ